MSETETRTPLPAIRRPNGMLYRPQKLVVEVFEGDGDAADFAVLVLGTHDTGVAKPLADAEVARSFGADCVAVKPTAGWWRQTIRRGEPYWDADTARGRAGVLFDVADEDENEAGND